MQKVKGGMVNSHSLEEDLVAGDKHIALKFVSRSVWSIDTCTAEWWDNLTGCIKTTKYM